MAGCVIGSYQILSSCELAAKSQLLSGLTISNGQPVACYSGAAEISRRLEKPAINLQEDRGLDPLCGRAGRLKS